MVVRQRTPQPTPPAPHATPSPTDDAWRTLQLLIDSIKHAEAKAAAALASSGVLGGLLYSLVSRTPQGDGPFAAAAVATAVAVMVAAISAGLALRPRILTGPDGPNLLFYATIVRGFRRDADAYAREFAALIADRPAMLAVLSSHIWCNATVASRKYRAVNVAVTALLTALSLLAVTAALSLRG